MKIPFFGSKNNNTLSKRVSDDSADLNAYKSVKFANEKFGFPRKGSEKTESSDGFGSQESERSKTEGQYTEKEQDLSTCYAIIPQEYFHEKFVLNLRDYLNDVDRNKKELTRNQNLVQKCIFKEVTEKFGFFLQIMTNFSEIELSISTSVQN